MIRSATMKIGYILGWWVQPEVEKANARHGITTIGLIQRIYLRSSVFSQRNVL